MIVAILIVVVVAVVAAVVSAPLRRPADRAEVVDERLAALEAGKEAKYREIRDAEADFHAGKLSEPDYRQLDRSLRSEAIEILREIEEVEGRPELPGRSL